MSGEDDPQLIEDNYLSYLYIPHDEFPEARRAFAWRLVYMAMPGAKIEDMIAGAVALEAYLKGEMEEVKLRVIKK